MSRADAERVEVVDRAAWRRWLQRRHRRPTGVWLVVAKKGRPGVSYVDAVEEALCFGWIDSTANRLDGDRYLLWMSPRRPTSVWSAANKRRVAALIRSGEMAEAGRVAIRIAKRNGSWNALSSSDSMVVPEDLAAALATVPRAQGHWDAFPPSSKRMILGWIDQAKREETRRRRVEQAAQLAGLNVRPPYPTRGVPRRDP